MNPNLMIPDWSQQTKISIGPILFLYYEEILVSSYLNSNLLRFHCAHPNVGTYLSNLFFPDR